MADWASLPPGTRVAVALSGGVDSAVAAALLLDRGCQVEGWTMRLSPRQAGAVGSLADGVESAGAICQLLSVPHRIVDLRSQFSAQVIGPFLGEYARGRTPNPCLWCNQRLKFGALMDAALASGCSHLATGHYARTDVAGGRYRLLTAMDASKDQSYFLYGLQQRHLAATLFPLGDWTKDRVRGYAASRHLPVAARSESQDVCFLAGEDYRSLLAREIPESVRRGPIYDVTGRLLGEHRGLPLYTIGQREGLGISAPQPLYVLQIDVARNALVVGDAAEASQTGFTIAEASWVSGEAPADGEPVHVRVRHRGALSAARTVLSSPDVQVALVTPRRDIAPGQAAVLYAGEEVLGGGIIGQVLTAPLGG